MQSHLSQLTSTLFVYQNGCNVGILRAGDRALLIDCGNGDVQAILDTLGVAHIDTILFTHHHRDSTSGVTALASVATPIGVPAAERPSVETVETFWTDPKT